MKCFDPGVSRGIRLGPNEYHLNDKYYVTDFSEWDALLRDWLAAHEKLVLGEEHLHVLAFLRTSYEKSKRHPVIRMVTAELSIRFGAEKGSVKYFHTLFPGGIHQAFLIGGLPMQDSCC